MARKQNRYAEDDDNFRPHKNRPLKHSRNIPGKGMRTINSYVEEDVDDLFDELYDDTTLYDNTTQ